MYLGGLNAVPATCYEIQAKGSTYYIAKVDGDYIIFSKDARYGKVLNDADKEIILRKGESPEVAGHKLTEIKSINLCTSSSGLETGTGNLSDFTLPS